MKVILKENMDNLGVAGSIVKVRDGYARNFLIPRNKAVPATKNSLKAFEHEKRLLEARQGKLRKEAETLKEQLEKTSCSISKKVGEQDKLFGSVTAQDIEAAFSEEGIKVDKKNILLEEPIKSLGVFTVPVRIVDDIVANTKVWVVRE